jgi:tetratricopeptide (TPR) repeat protein
MQTVSQQAEGCFLWAELYLEHLNRPCSLDILEKRLMESFPPGLVNMYDVLLQNSLESGEEYTLAERRDLFLLLCEAQEHLSISDLAGILKLGHLDHRQAILKLGSPLLTTRGDKIIFIHASAKEYLTSKPPSHLNDNIRAIFVSSSQSHSRLAKECLRCLLEPKYASRGRIGQLLHHTLSTLVGDDDADDDLQLEQRDSDENNDASSHELSRPGTPGGQCGSALRVHEENTKISYAYASKYWGCHLTAVLDPSDPLLDLTQSFLHQNQFAHWSESSINESGNINYVSSTGIDLREWHKNLPAGGQKRLELSDYFVGSYERLIREYQDSESEDRELQWLAGLRIGRYLVNMGKGIEAIPVIDQAVAGLVDLLGSKHPATLIAKSDRAILSLQQGRFQEAYDDFNLVAEAQEDILGKKAKALYRTLLGRGGAELFMNRYEDSLATQYQVGQATLRISGPDSNEYQSARMWFCYVLIQMGKLTEADDILEPLLEKRKSQYGAKDVFASTTQYCIGDIQRKLRMQVESLRNLREAIETRRSVVPLTNFELMDCVISLLIAYRDFGMRDEALKTVEILDNEANVENLFDRYCQVTHLRALLLWDDGDVSGAISILQSLVVETDRSKYNRSFMWVLLDLALLLRARDEHGDKEQAASNFDNILFERSSPNSNINTLKLDCACTGGILEPDPPRLLKLAEQALTLLRKKKFDDITKLFEREQVGWFRQEDIWLSYGAPAADTAVMRGLFKPTTNLNLATPATGFRDGKKRST